MVKFEDNTKKERKTKERMSRLAEIAQEVLPELGVRPMSYSGLAIYLPEDLSEYSEATRKLMEKYQEVVLEVWSTNRIDVKSIDYSNSAVKLAETYESRGEPEFTVRFNYPV